jgi:hypothetical protein
MAIKVVVIPIAVMLNEYEQMGVDDAPLRKRVMWQGEEEAVALNRLDELLSENYQIVDVQKVTIKRYEWLRYTLHLKPKKAKKVRGETRFLQQTE